MPVGSLAIGCPAGTSPARTRPRARRPTWTRRNARWPVPSARPRTCPSRRPPSWSPCGAIVDNLQWRSPGRTVPAPVRRRPSGEIRGHDQRRRHPIHASGDRRPTSTPRPSSSTSDGSRPNVGPALERHRRRRQGLASALEGPQVAVDRAPPDGLRGDRRHLREGLRSGGHGRRWHPERPRRQRARDAASRSSGPRASRRAPKS